jgi:hypothetical protein
MPVCPICNLDIKPQGYHNHLKSHTTNKTGMFHLEYIGNLAGKLITTIFFTAAVFGLITQLSYTAGGPSGLFSYLYRFGYAAGQDFCVSSGFCSYFNFTKPFSDADRASFNTFTESEYMEGDYLKRQHEKRNRCVTRLCKD